MERSRLEQTKRAVNHLASTERGRKALQAIRSWMMDSGAAMDGPHLNASKVVIESMWYSAYEVNDIITDQIGEADHE